MRYITDAGHGWLEVSLKEYPDATKYGTGYGFIDVEGGFIFLEEDCEMPAFLEAHPELRANIRHMHIEGDCIIRNLPRNPRSVKVGIGF